MKSKLRSGRSSSWFEFFIAMAVIGILTTVVVGALRSAHDKARDAVIKSAFTQFHLQAEIESMSDATQYRESSLVDSPLVAEATKNSNGAAVVHFGGGTTGTASWWRAYVKLRSVDEYYCIDSGGFSGEIGQTAPGGGNGEIEQLCQ